MLSIEKSGRRACPRRREIRTGWVTETGDRDVGTGNDSDRQISTSAGCGGAADVNASALGKAELFLTSGAGGAGKSEK